MLAGAWNEALGAGVGRAGAFLSAGEAAPPALHTRPRGKATSRAGAWPGGRGLQRWQGDW